MALIDEANRKDPRREWWEGEFFPKEWLYGQRMSAWLGRLVPDASELLQIAVRAQHMCRWEHPRSSYEEGRAGYLRWRCDLYAFHAQRALEVMQAVGYDRAAMDRVRELLLKKSIVTDPEASRVEDVACLVFLEFYFADFSSSHEEEKIIRILQKTWGKMSPLGRAAAGTIAFSPEAQRILKKALSPAQ